MFIIVIIIIIIIIVFSLGSDRLMEVSILMPLFLQSSSVSLSYHSCCSYARVFGKTLVQEFPISHGHTEWYFLFARNDMVEMVEELPVKN